MSTSESTSVGNDSSISETCSAGVAGAPSARQASQARLGVSFLFSPLFKKFDRQKRMPPVSADDVVAQASQLLTVVMHCRKQAAELQACQERGTGKRLLSGRCERERAAFVTCSEEHVGVVIGHLVKFADKHCPAEVEAFRWCKSHTPGADCEQEDLAALRCASAQVLASARANSANSRTPP